MIFEKYATVLFMDRQVVLVDEQDRELGTEDIYEAHRGKGLKHRALSVILYRRVNGKVELLHQKRAEVKPVFKGLWSNTCCTNLRSGDEYLPRAVSRLDEEMGIKIDQKDLRIIYRFSYEVEDDNQPGWCENEVDTVIVGEWDPSASSGQAGIRINPEEASDYKWIEWDELKNDIAKNPEIYSPWHKMIINYPRFVEEVING